MHKEAIQEEKLTRAFTPLEAIIYDPDFLVQEHLTLVVDCAKDIQLTLAPYIAELRQQDKTGSLSFTPSENLHMTLQYPVHKDMVAIARNVTTAALRGQSAQLDVYGMHIRPQGISLACYSPNGELIRLRSALADATDFTFDPQSRLANIGWITIARFVNVPSEKVVSNVVSHVNTSFGALDLAGNVHLYSSNHRQRIGAKKIW